MDTALILCGGLGTRLRARVVDRPKSLAIVAGRPFLAHQLDWLRANGIARAILAAGYLGDQILEFARGAGAGGIALDVVLEREQLGSGGAVANAIRDVNPVGSRILVLNGDTFFRFQVGPMEQVHSQSGSQVTLALKEMDDAHRFGTVRADAGSIRGFHEANGVHSPGLVHAGAYVGETAFLREAGQGAFSMERDVFPGLAAQGRMAGYLLPHDALFLDIGTPDAYDEVSGSGWRESRA